MRIYIAGPYTQPDPVANSGRAALVFNELMDLGFWPYCPHLMSYLPIAMKPGPPRTYDHWMAHCFEWLCTCQVVLRLPGPSPGSDQETELAERMQIPVVPWSEDGSHVDALLQLSVAMKEQCPPVSLDGQDGWKLGWRPAWVRRYLDHHPPLPIDGQPEKHTGSPQGGSQAG